MKASFIASILALGIASVSAQRRGTASVEIFAGLTGESAVTEVVIDQGLQPVNGTFAKTTTPFLAPISISEKL